MPFSRQTCQDFLEGVLTSVYSEADDLIGMPDAGEGPAPRSTERAIVARMAVHAERSVRRVFTKDSVADVEYERVGGGRDAKEGRDGNKVSPDLIVHERTRPAANYLAIEVKRATTPRRRAWRRQDDALDLRVSGPDADDIDKVAYYAHLEALQPPQHSYHWSVYVELDRNGADFWWIRANSLEDPRGRVVPTPGVIHPHRWHRPEANRLPRARRRQQ